MKSIFAKVPRTKTVIILPVLLILTLLFYLTERKDSREKYEDKLNKHAFSSRGIVSIADLKKIPKKDRPDLAWEQDFLKTMDPAIGRPTRERLLPIYEKVNKFKRAKAGIPGDDNNNWVERGPSNVGGRVRALMFDPNDAENKKVWAGSVAGGLWYTNDITNSDEIWHAVNDTWQNLAISSITYDPNNPQIFYVSTGEGWGNLDAVRGLGVWKSEDAGNTWNHLINTHSENFKTVQKLVVTQSSRILAATNDGIFVSDDNGNNWSKKLSGFTADLEVASNGTIYAGKGGRYKKGGVYKSTDNGNTWNEITPNGTTQYRVEIAVSPSNPKIIYAVAAGSDEISWFKKSVNEGALWTDVVIPKYSEGCANSKSDFTRGQHWYDLILAVQPDNPDIIIAGGIDLNKSIDGGKTWNSISNWAGWCRTYVHADQHAIVFRPGNNNEAIFGNDGGVAYSTNVGTAEAPSFIIRNIGFNVTQFYSCAIHPDLNKNYYLGGTQDNGSQQCDKKGISEGVEVTGGDGGFCFIDQKVPSIQITSYINNNYYYSTDGGSSFNTLQASDEGSFINPAAYDSNLGILFSAKNRESLSRIKNLRSAPKIERLSLKDLGTKVSHISVSPYTKKSSTLFVGGLSGRLVKITNADGNSPQLESIGDNNFPKGAISCVELGANESEILVVFSNYGVKSLWYTTDGGKNWIDKEGNLPDMPIRWALFNPNDRKQVLLATEVGVWATKNFDAENPLWSPSNSGLANVRVDMLRMRESDNQIIAATHGRGLFTNDAFSKINKDELKAVFSTKGSRNIGLGVNVEFENLSNGSPDSCLWTFEGGIPENSNLQNPSVKYIKKGTYKVTLTVYKGDKKDTKTKESYVMVEGKAGWLKQATGFAEQGRGIDHIDVVNANIVWAIAFDGSGSNKSVKEFTKTLDGGKTWKSDTIGITGNVGIAMVCAQSKDTAWIPVYPNEANAGGGIYQTVDGGKTWNKQATAKFEGEDAFANVVYFWDKKNGFCMGDPNGGYFEIYTTKDGGENWQRVESSKIPAAKEEEYGTVGYFCVADDETVFFNTTKGRIFKSKDKGYTWTAIKTPFTVGNKCAFSDENNGVLIELSSKNSVNPKVFRTSDGGTKWIKVDNKNVFNSYIEYVQGSEKMYVSTGMSNSKSGASYSVDGGETWTKFDKQNGSQCMYIDFFDISLGWVGKYSKSATEGGIDKYSGTITIPDFKMKITNKEDMEVDFTDITLSRDDALNYEWNFGEDATPQKANSKGPHTVKYSKEGSKVIKLTVNGLYVKKTLIINATAVQNIEHKEETVTIYPNPANDEVNIDFKSGNAAKNRFFYVYKLNGKLVYVDKIAQGDKKTIYLAKYGKGLYLIKTYDGHKISTHKVVIN